MKKEKEYCFYNFYFKKHIRIKRCRIVFPHSTPFFPSHFSIQIYKHIPRKTAFPSLSLSLSPEWREKVPQRWSIRRSNPPPITSTAPYCLISSTMSPPSSCICTNKSLRKLLLPIPTYFPFVNFETAGKRGQNPFRFDSRWIMCDRCYVWFNLGDYDYDRHF